MGHARARVLTGLFSLAAALAHAGGELGEAAGPRQINPRVVPVNGVRLSVPAGQPSLLRRLDSGLVLPLANTPTKPSAPEPERQVAVLVPAPSIAEGLGQLRERGYAVFSPDLVPQEVRESILKMNPQDMGMFESGRFKWLPRAIQEFGLESTRWLLDNLAGEQFALGLVRTDRKRLAALQKAPDGHVDGGYLTLTAAYGDGENLGTTLYEVDEQGGVRELLVPTGAAAIFTNQEREEDVGVPGVPHSELRVRVPDEKGERRLLLLRWNAGIMISFPVQERVRRRERAVLEYLNPAPEGRRRVPPLREF